MEYLCVTNAGEYGRGSTPEAAYKDLEDCYGVEALPSECEFFEIRSVKVEMRLVLMPAE